MGLDITAYERLHLVTAKPVGEWDTGATNFSDAAYLAGRVTLYVLEPFRDRADGLVDGDYDKGGEEHGFRAGSYGGYNEWRRQLARLVDVTPEELWNGGPGAKKTPFYELIHFSDCEGVIGPKTAAKLARDFAEYQERADATADAYFREAYAEWRKAFEIAAKGGAVTFH
jgi:hypothetical protein